MPAFLLAIVTISGALLWIGVNLPSLLHLTGELLSWCMDMAELCLDYAGLSKAMAMWAVSLLLGSGAVYGAYSALRRHLAARAALGKLPIIQRQGLSISMINDDNIKTAFVHGIFRPKVYVSTGLIRILSRDELKAVVLHEACHRRAKDPLRFHLYAMLRDVFYFLPIAGVLARRLVLKRELMADDRALSGSADPLILASAILKAAGARNNASLASQGAYFSDECHTSTRIKRILGEAQPERRLPLKAGIASLVMAAFMLAALLIPLGSVHAGHDACDTSHCAAHDMTMGENCGLHCSKSEGYPTRMQH